MSLGYHPLTKTKTRTVKEDTMHKFALFISLGFLLLFALIVYNGTRVDSLERKVEALENVAR